MTDWKDHDDPANWPHPKEEKGLQEIAGTPDLFASLKRINEILNAAWEKEPQTLEELGLGEIFDICEQAGINHD